MRRLTCILTLILLTQLSTVAAAQRVNREYQLKAVYVYHLAQLVRWPAAGENPPPFRIRIWGPDRFGARGGGHHLRVLKDRLEQRLNRDVVIEQTNNIDTAKTSDLLFVNRAQPLSDAQKRALRGAAVLVVTEDQQLGAGAMVNISVRNNRMRIQYHKGRIEAANLRFPGENLPRNFERVDRDN